MGKRVLYFTDAHDRVDLPVERFAWLGRMAKKIKPDIIINGGDTFDVDSLNAHARNETWEGKLKPAFEKELAHLCEAFRAFDDEAPKDIPLHITLGNHEHRIWTYENNNPEVYGILSQHFLDLLKTHRYTFTPYKAYFNYEGVDFTHAPIGPMGKPLGGKTAAQRAADQSLRDVVYGHTHIKTEAISAKLGGGNEVVRAYNGGCYMPNQYRMSYAQCSQNHWDYGVTLLVIDGGQIKSNLWFTIDEIERSFG